MPLIYKKVMILLCYNLSLPNHTPLVKNQAANEGEKYEFVEYAVCRRQDGGGRAV
ncbi:hypothetical protein [Ferruginibacter sp.]|nr:hypothetical protein [Ferruginibacter sp.]